MNEKFVTKNRPRIAAFSAFWTRNGGKVVLTNRLETRDREKRRVSVECTRLLYTCVLRTASTVLQNWLYDRQHTAECLSGPCISLNVCSIDTFLKWRFAVGLRIVCLFDEAFLRKSVESTWVVCWGMMSCSLASVCKGTLLLWSSD